MFGKTASVQLPNALDHNDMPSMLDGAVPLLVLALSFLLVGLHVAKVRLMKVQPALPIKTGKSKPKQRKQRRGKQGKAHSGQQQRHVIVQQRPAQHQDAVAIGRTGSKEAEKFSARFSEIDVESAVAPTEELSEPERLGSIEEAASEGDCESGLQTRAIADQTQECRSANELHMGESLVATASPYPLQEQSSSLGATAESLAAISEPTEASAADEEVKAAELQDLLAESEDLPVESEDLPASTSEEQENENDKHETEENENEEKWSEWGCSSRQIYYRELLLAHCSISKRIARGPPGLTLPEERQGDAAGHLGITLVARD